LNNIVLVVADDMRWDLLDWMPQTLEKLLKRGVRMLNGFNQNPVCIPSRTTILTGNYSTTTGIVGNHFPFEQFDDSHTLATVLKDAGYVTGHFGKYVNNYNPDDAAYIPPGWDDWWTITNGGTDYYGYQVSDNGSPRIYGTDPEDYLTRVIGSRAERFIRHAGEPFFAYITPTAPHMNAIPESRYEDMYVNLPGTAPSFNEEDVSDKAKWIQQTPRLNAADKEEIKKRHRNMIRTLQSVDDMINNLVIALKNRGAWHNTTFIFCSDNGYQLGEHRLLGKSVPYLESVRMPLVISAPLLGTGTNDVALFQNADLAPTLASLAGTSMGTTDGVDMTPALYREAASRKAVYIEHPAHGVVPGFEMVQGKAFSRSGQTPQWSYTKLTTGEEEYYNLREDPYQQRNIADKTDLLEAREMLRELRP